MTLEIIPHSKPWITKEDIQAVEHCLASNLIAQGALKARFENEVASYLRYDSAIATPSGTCAQTLLLKALNIGDGDKVIIPTYVCKSVLEGVIHTGATPVLCDTSGSWVMTPEDVAKVFDPAVKAIILVHIFGIDASSPDFFSFNVPVIDDLCQAFGLRLSSPGNGGAFCSFHATKCMTTGEGGMALTNNAQAKNRFEVFKNSGMRAYGAFSDLQASLGLSQLARYPWFLRRRREIAQSYIDALPLRYTETIAKLALRSMFFRFPITMNEENINNVISKADHQGVAVRKGVDALLHRQLGLSDAPYPNAVKRFRTTASLPIYPALTQLEITKTITALEAYCE